MIILNLLCIIVGIGLLFEKEMIKDIEYVCLVFLKQIMSVVLILLGIISIIYN